MNYKLQFQFNFYKTLIRSKISLDIIKILRYSKNMKEQSQPTNNTLSPIPQNFKKYNRESGKKTLVFVGILIILIVIFTFLSIFLLSRPQILTSSIETQLTPTSVPQK